MEGSQVSGYYGDTACLEGDPGLLTDRQSSVCTDSSDGNSESYDSDDARRELEKFDEISQRFLEELTLLEAEFEDTEQEEEGAIEVNNEDSSLEQISPHTVPTMHHFSEDKPLLEEEEDQTSLEPETGSDYKNQEQEDLQETVRKLQEEKKQNKEEIEELKGQIQILKEKVEEERLERKSLAGELMKKQRDLLKLNRVSQAVTQEYTSMMGELELEQDLRHTAETLAHKMLREKRAVCRQSMILMQNLEPNEMLMKALEDVRILTTTLDETKQELQTQVRSLTSQLEERPSQEDVDLIKEELNAVNIIKAHLEEQMKAEQERRAALQAKVDKLEQEMKNKESSDNSQVERVEAQPPPAPPPPPPCLFSKAPEDPLALIKMCKRIKAPAAKPKTVGPDVRDKAVEEMKKRIEEGISLRPIRRAGRDASTRNKRKSVISELQGILLKATQKPLRRVNPHKISCKKKKNDELTFKLQKQREIAERNIGEINEISTQMKSLETPTQTWSVETPNQTKSVETPNQTRSVETPNQTRSVATPNQTRSVETPNQTRNVETPNQTRSVETPNQTRSVETPNQTRSVETPNQSRSVETPNQKRSVETPNQSRSVETPNQARSVETPNQSRSVETPNHSRSVETPNHSRSVETPNHSRSVETPNQTRSVETPNQTRSVETPNQTMSVETPNQPRNVETPNQSRSVEMPNQMRSVEELRKRTEKDGVQNPEVTSFQNSPVLIKMRQRASPSQSRHASQVQWQ